MLGRMQQRQPDRDCPEPARNADQLIKHDKPPDQYDAGTQYADQAHRTGGDGDEPAR